MFEPKTVRISSPRRRLVGAILVAVALASGVAVRTLVGQDLPQPAADTYQRNVLPVLQKNCFSCHNDRQHAGNLSLEALREPATALAHQDVWVKVLDKLKAGTMPPRTMPALPPSDS